MAWLGRNSYHFGLASFSPLNTRRFSSASVLVDSTPSIWRSSHSRASTLSSVSYLEHAPSGVLTITASTSLEAP